MRRVHSEAPAPSWVEAAPGAPPSWRQQGHYDVTNLTDATNESRESRWPSCRHYTASAALRCLCGHIAAVLRRGEWMMG